MTLLQTLVDADTVAAAVAAAGIVGGVWRWAEQRRAERADEQRTTTTRYVVPLLFAANDLQSRFYNLACGEPWTVVPHVDDRRRFAVETVHLMAEYFRQERPLLCLTPLGRDPRILPRIEAVRAAFADARGPEDRDPWCVFRVRQHEWGQSLGPRDEPSCSVSSLAVRLDDGTLDPIGGGAMLRSFDDGAPPARSLERFAAVQCRLVDLLEELERAADDRPPWYRPFRRARHEPLTLFPGGRSKACPAESRG